APPPLVALETQMICHLGFEHSLHQRSLETLEEAFGTEERVRRFRQFEKFFNELGLESNGCRIHAGFSFGRDRPRRSSYTNFLTLPARVRCVHIRVPCLLFMYSTPPSLFRVRCSVPGSLFPVPRSPTWEAMGACQRHREPEDVHRRGL